MELKTELAEKAFGLEQRMNKCLVAIRENYLELGLVASQLKAGKLYKLVTPEALNWEHYISLKIVGLKRGQLDNYSYVAKTIGNLIKDRNIDITRALDISRIVRSLPEPEREAKAKELIESAETLPKSGWIDTLREIRGLTASDCCEHPADKQTMYNHCEICGKWNKI